MTGEHLGLARDRLAEVGLEPPADAHVFSNDPWRPAHGIPTGSRTRPTTWRPRPVSSSTIKGLRHYTASQLLASRFDLRNIAARLGHSSGGATTLRHYADPVSEVDRRAATYLAQLTAGSAVQST